MFAVEDVEDVLAPLAGHGAELVGGLTRLDGWRMCYLLGPEGIMDQLS